MERRHEVRLSQVAGLWELFRVKLPASLNHWLKNNKHSVNLKLGANPSVNFVYARVAKRGRAYSRAERRDVPKALSTKQWSAKTLLYNSNKAEKSGESRGPVRPRPGETGGDGAAVRPRGPRKGRSGHSFVRK